MNFKISDSAEFIISQLNNNGFQAYLVGGCVRDELMGNNAIDCDITTNAFPEQVKKVFSEYNVVETGIKHGTVTVVIDHTPFEITTYRTEFGYTDSRHPDKVLFVGDLKTDLSRRDFTMNAIAYSPKEGIVDYFGGLNDIKSGIIRSVGDAKVRFSEDALRILRALRFSVVLGFQIEENTSKAIFELANTIKIVSPERIYTELKKLISGKNAPSVLAKYKEALSHIIPINAPPEDISRFPNDFPMRLTYLCGGDVMAALEFLRADNETKYKCNLLVNSKPIPEDETDLKLYVSSLGREDALYVANYRKTLYGEDRYNKLREIVNSDLCLDIKELKINGNDLLGLGIGGKNIGKMLNYLLLSVIKNELENDKELLLETAKNIDISKL